MLEKEITVTVLKEKSEEMPKDHKQGESWQKEAGICIGYAPFAPEDQLGNYVIRRWTWKEKQQAMIDSSEIYDRDRGLAKVDLVAYEIAMMLTCVKDSPIELTKELFETIDPDLGDLLVDACRIVNGLPTGEKQDFLGQSEPDKAIPG